MHMYTTPYQWIIRNDDNRAEDGRALREEFASESYILDLDPDWFELDCSFLEFLIALARRVSFDSEGDTEYWFWIFIENMEIHHYHDKQYNNQAREEVEQAMDRIMSRSYSPSGRGGLFPLRNAKTDQRKVEIWYQMSSYLLERDDFGE